MHGVSWVQMKLLSPCFLRPYIHNYVTISSKHLFNYHKQYYAFLKYLSTIHKFPKNLLATSKF
jgi:hypothetical protein